MAIVATKLTVIIVSLIVLTLAGATLITLRAVQSNLTGQVGGNFEDHAESVGQFVGLFLYSNANKVQVLSQSHSLHASTAERNASYQGSETQILAELQALDQRWQEAPDNDPLILSITFRKNTADTVDPVHVQTAGRTLADFLDLFEEHSEVFLTDRYGGTIAATGRLSDYYQADELWWQAAWNNGDGAVYISDPQHDESAGVTALLIAVPVFDHDTGSVIGVLRSTLNVDGLLGLIAGTTFGEFGYAAILDSNGTAIVDPSGRAIEAIQFLPREQQEQLIAPGTGYNVSSDTIFGHATISSPRPLPDSRTEQEVAALQAVSNLHWTVVTQQDASEAFSTSSVIKRVAWVAGTIAPVVAAIAAIIVAQAMTRPLQRLSVAACQIAKARWTCRCHARAGTRSAG